MIILTGDSLEDSVRVTGDLEDNFKYSLKNRAYGCGSYMYIALSTGDLILARNGINGSVFTHVSGHSKVEIKPNKCKIHNYVSWVLFSAINYDDEANPLLLNKEYTSVYGSRIYVRELNYGEGYLLYNTELGVRAEHMDIEKAVEKIEHLLDITGAVYEKFKTGTLKTRKAENAKETDEAVLLQETGYIRPGAEGKTIPVLIPDEDLGSLKRVMALCEDIAKKVGWKTEDIEAFRKEALSGGFLNFSETVYKYFDLLEF